MSNKMRGSKPKKKSSKELGDCYQAAVKTAERLERAGYKNVRIVHGTALGTGGDVKGIRYGHAWVEATVNGTNTVFDFSNGNDVVVEKILYYLAGHIVDDHRYSHREALECMLRTGHYGPWQ